MMIFLCMSKICLLTKQNRTSKKLIYMALNFSLVYYLAVKR